LIFEDFSPFSEGLIGCNQDGSAFVAGTDQFKENACFRLIFGDVGEVVENQKMIFVKFGDCGL